MVKSKKILFILMIAAFIISLVPLYIAGGFAHPSVDDYYYSVNTAKTWQDTGSFSEVVSESFSEMQQTYNEWQGNFSAIFLMRLQPALFGEDCYIFTTVILLTSFVIAMLVFLYNVARRFFGVSRIKAFALAIPITFCALQFTYKPSDSFYWFNGGIYYTFFFSLSLILFTLTLMVYKARKTFLQLLALFFAFPLAFLVGGGNYSTALFVLCIFVVLLIVLIIKKNTFWIPLLLITFCVLGGLLLSIMAPGNAVRMEADGNSPGIFKAILYSFAYGGYVIGDSTTFPVVCLFVGLTPFIYNMTKNISFGFKKPVLAILIAFCLFCTQGTPLFYAEGIHMPYRMSNIIYFNYYFFMFFSITYLYGYFAKRYPENPFEMVLALIYLIPKRVIVFAVSIVFFFAVGCVGLCNVSEGPDGNASFELSPLSVKAVYTLVNGDAVSYDDELNQRAALLSNAAQSGVKGTVLIPPLSVCPDPIFHTEITEDFTHWKNQHLALFYGLDAVALSK